LPKMGFAGAAELVFIMAMTDRIGGEAITKRIQEKFDGSENFHHAGLALSTSYRLLEATKRNPSESIEHFRENVASKIQELMNEEVSSRQTNG
jgi:hypothetical protein